VSASRISTKSDLGSHRQLPDTAYWELATQTP